MFKMREFMRITFVCVCVFLFVRNGRCEDPGSLEVPDTVFGKSEEQDRKDGKGLLTGEFCGIGSPVVQMYVTASDLVRGSNRRRTSG